MVSIITEENFAKGKIEGLAEGEHKKAIKMAEKMIKAGKSFDEIADFTELSVEIIQKLISHKN